MSYEYILCKNNWGDLKHTLYDQQQAFDELRKRVAVDCFMCHGLGIEEWSFLKCFQCEGETQLCSFCNSPSTVCDCGS